MALAEPADDGIAVGHRGEPARVDVERQHPLDLAARRVGIRRSERVDRDRPLAGADARAARDVGAVRHYGDVEMARARLGRVGRRPEADEEGAGLLERERPAGLDDVPRHGAVPPAQPSVDPQPVQRPPTGAEPEP